MNEDDRSARVDPLTERPSFVAPGSNSILEVLTQHAEEAAFHWLLRDAAVGEPHYRLNDLTELDDKIEAHLDGLRVAGDAGWDVVTEVLPFEEPGEVFVAAVLAFESGDPDLIEGVSKLGAEDVWLSRGVSSALAWLGPERARPLLPKFLDSPLSPLVRAGVSAAAILRLDLGHKLGAATASRDPVVRSRALRAAGELGRTGLMNDCRSAARFEDVDSQFWGAWSAFLLGDERVVATLLGFAEREGPFAERAARTVARRMEPGDAASWREDLALRMDRARIAAIVAGEAGNPAAVPWLLECMADDELSRPAGEAFSLITGADLAYEDLERDAPEEPEDEADNAHEDLDSDEDLPFADPELVAAWWSRNRSRFADGNRYLCGKPTSPEAASEVLRTGFQRQRASAALELALAAPSRPLFEVRARGDVQRKQLGITGAYR